ncbi:MAG: efflux RND transporter permease subunit [Phycisphaerales bacterium]|nr:efflux RND transporter permease subunit [Phycisphaerales bacterium]
MISYFTRHPTAANLLMLILLSAGILSLRNLRRETFPDFTSGEVRITVVYPGATAEDVEEVICSRVEDALDGVRFIEELRSEAREGVGVITAEMVEGADFRTFKDEIETEVDAIDDFPEDVEDPVIEELHTTDPVLSLLVSGPMTAPDLKAYCEDFKTRLQAQTNVSLVTIQGFADHQFRIELSQEALMRHGLSVADVVDVVERQSVDLPVGTIETGERDILVRFVDQRKSVRELEELVVVGGRAGGELKVRDIGRVVDLFELEEDRIILGDRRAGLLAVKKTKDQDILRVANTVKDFVDDERARHPKLDIRITQDHSTLVADRLTMLTRNGWQGMILVFAVMWLFFNAKLSFWVVMSLPVSFLGAFFFVPHFDMTINMLTMVGLLLALGLLMDDGIVIAENVASHAARGKPAMQAATDGVVEVGPGVISSFVTTICVLGPLAALEGNIGKILKVVPIMLILVLAVSLIEAFMILPAHLGHSLDGREGRPVNRFRRTWDGVIDRLRERVLGRCVDVLVRWRYLWVGCVLFVFLFSLGLFVGGVVKFQAFPELDGDVVVARVLMPPGTPFDRTEATVRKLTEGLSAVNDAFRSRQPGRQDLVQTVYTRFNVNDDAFETGPHVATVFADLLTAEERDARIDDVLQSWRSAVGKVPDVHTLNYTEPTLGPAGRNIEVRLYGDDLQSLRDAGMEMQAWFAEFRGVNNLTIDLRPGKPELRIRLREGAFGLGLNARTVARQLRGAFQGLTADEIQVGPESYEIDVTFAASERDSLADLSYFHCTLPNGRQVPLSDVARIEPGIGWSRIARVDGRRTVTLRGDVDSLQTNTASVIGVFQETLLAKLSERFPEIDVSIEGELEEAAVTQDSMRWGMVIGVIGVFVLLSFQFRSYVEPLVVMAAIPFALIGVIWGHLLMGIDISMPSLLGFVSLAGIVVNDSILLVIFLKLRRAEGMNVEEAAAQASRERFRAIMITSLTTIAGLLPLLSEQSLQAQVLIPLAISIVFGLLASTVLVLLVIPCLYAILSDVRTAIESRRLKTR